MNTIKQTALQRRFGSVETDMLTFHSGLTVRISVRESTEWLTGAVHRQSMLDVAAEAVTLDIGLFNDWWMTLPIVTFWPAD